MHTARKTFRDKAEDEICHQYVLRTQYDAADAPLDVESLRLKDSVVRQVSRKFAKQIIFKYEWLGTMSAGTMECFGLFFGLHCAGVVCFAAPGSTPGMATMLQIDSSKLTYLARGACVHWAPANSNSRLVNIACRLQHKLTGRVAAFAFSDTDAGELGTIYQACGWTCLGRGQPTEQFVSPEGRIWSNQSMTRRQSSRGITTVEMKRRLIANGWKVQKTNPKYRYAFVMDKRERDLIRRIADLKTPYPKRQKEAALASVV
jgi:hypothetical protein